MAWSKTRTPAAGSGYEWQRRRQAVIERDGGVCQLRLDGCTGRATTADHIVGRAAAHRQGWTEEQIDSMSNLQASCRSCNEVKRQRQAIEGRRPSRQREAEPHPGLLR